MWQEFCWQTSRAFASEVMLFTRSYPNIRKTINPNLLITARGEAAANTAGMVVALLEQASKLEPNLNPPTLQIKNGNK